MRNRMVNRFQDNQSKGDAKPPVKDLPELWKRVRQAVPADLLERHPDLVEAAVCGHLFKQGCEDDRLVRRVCGRSVAQMVVRICKLLDDPDASAWYFRTLDEASCLADHSSQKASENDGATCGLWRESRNARTGCRSLEAIPPESCDKSRTRIIQDDSQPKKCLPQNDHPTMKAFDQESPYGKYNQPMRNQGQLDIRPMPYEPPGPMLHEYRFLHCPSCGSRVSSHVQRPRETLPCPKCRKLLELSISARLSPYGDPSPPGSAASSEM